MNIREMLDEIFDILVRAGADEYFRETFIRRQSQKPAPWEWRFRGDLGRGGKFYRNEHKKEHGFWINCYPEDMTPDKKKIIQDANLRLDDIYKRYKKDLAT